MRRRVLTASLFAAAMAASGCVRPAPAPPPVAAGELVPVAPEPPPAPPPHRHNKVRHDRTGLTAAQKQRVFSDFDSWESRKDAP